jgi:hypothetical protein
MIGVARPLTPPGIGEPGLEEPPTRVIVKEQTAVVPAVKTVTATTTVMPGLEQAGELGLVPLQVGRQIIYSAYIRLVVEDVRQTASRLITLASSYGGFVSESSIGSSWGSVTLRVPVSGFQDALKAIEQLGEVEQTSINSRDVTEEFVDLEARLRNLQRQEERLLELLDKAASVRDVLEVERELTRVRAEIERIQGRLNLLGRLVELATVSVELVTERLEEKPPLFDWSATWAMALSLLFTVVSGIVIIAFATAPLVVLGAVVYLAYRWWRTRAVDRSG